MDRILRPHFASVVVLLALVATATGVSGTKQRSLPQGEPVPGEAGIAQLHKLPGRVLVEGKNDRPVGTLRLRRYRLEELELPHELEVNTAAGKRLVKQAWRLIIVGGPFTVRNMPAIISLNGVKLGVGVESSNLMELSVIIFDRALLQDRGKIVVSYSEDSDDQTELPERLALPAR